MTLAQLGLLLFVLNRLNAKVKEFNQGRQTISREHGRDWCWSQQLTDDAAASNTIQPGEVAFERLQQEIVLEDVEFEFPDRHVRGRHGRVEGQVGAARECRRRFLQARSPRSWGTPARASRPSSSCFRGFATRTPAAITFDGVDVKDFEVGSLRKGIGYLTQSAMLFNDTRAREPRLRPGLRADRRRRSGTRSSGPTPRSSTTCRTGSRPSWAIAACGSPEGSASASGWRACCSTAAPC